MKRAFLIVGMAMAVFAAVAQDYNYVPWQPNMGPLTFNTLGDAQHPYVQCKTSSSWNNPSNIVFPSNTSIWNPAATATTHAIITSDTADPCRCYTAGNVHPHENYLPPSWDGSYSDMQDTVIRIGCGNPNSACNRASQIEYWFYPQAEESILMVMSSFAMQNACNGNYCSHGVNINGCASITNQQFVIEVLDGETGQLLNLGYYPTKASQMTGNPIANLNWPYSRFLAWPSGCNAGDDSQNPMDSYGVITYYWAGQYGANGSMNANGYATPTTYPYRECPNNQTAGYSSNYPVQWFEYKPYVFDLKSIASQNVDANGNFVANKSVKLRIRTIGCSATAHWIYGLFTATMKKGTGNLDVCGDDLIKLSVPWGFLPQSYEWHYGYDSADATMKIMDMFDVPPGITSDGQYNIYIDPNIANVYPYYRCELKSYTGVPIIYEAYIKSHFIEPNFTIEQQLNNCELRVTLSDSSSIYTTTPPSGPGQPEDTVYHATQFIKWYVKRNDHFDIIPGAENLVSVDYTFNINDSAAISDDGTATFMMVVQDEKQKCEDTLVKTIQLDLSVIQNSYSVDTITVSEDMLPYVYDPEHFGDTYTWSSAGTRRVIYEGQTWNGCDSIVDVTLVVISGDAVPVYGHFDGKVFPNPASGTLYIRPTDEKPYQWSLSDLSGKTILSGESAGNTELDIHTCPAGMYLLHINQEGQKSSMKIMIR